MKALVVLLSIILLFSFSNKCNADGIPHLPSWQDTIVNGQRFSCYDLEGTKKLLMFETDAQTLYDESRTFRTALDNDMFILANDQKIINAQRAEINTLFVAYTDQAKELNATIAEKNKYKYQARFDLGPGLGWIIAGGITLVSAGVVAGLVLR